MSPLFGLLCPGPHERAVEPAYDRAHGPLYERANDDVNDRSNTPMAKRAPTRTLLAWPLPAVLAWAGGWTVWRLATGAGMASTAAFGLALLTSLAFAWFCPTRWRRAIAAGGFPMAALALGVGALPSWSWLVLLLPLLAAYPLRTWRDAPFFPTPADALDGITAVVEAPPQRVLDVGCGLGHGLRALRAAWPLAELHGVEWSLPLSALARLRCRAIGARVQRADMWVASWASYDLVYLFQRPENMARAFAKARAELAPGAWFVSLEFAVPDAEAEAGSCLQRCLQAPGRRALWIYRMPGVTAVHSIAPRPRR
ncbi:MAG: class I SAM-dependent methyltransferase [Pseudomonadota bacterium]|nr:class I SAM-dependent methyltransferase [Pseudomonadota bacterium]